jgi:hypothetical protein
LCQFKPYQKSRPYSLKEVDFFVAYVIPRDVWYVIPAAVILRGKGIKAGEIKAMTLLPEKARHPERYRFEAYREAWELMVGKRRAASAARAGARVANRWNRLSFL